MRYKIFLMLFVLALVSCKNEKKEDEHAATDNNVQTGEMVEDETAEIAELPNPSDVSFDIALDAYKSGDHKKAADMIAEGIVNLRKEETSTPKSESKLLDDYVNSLRTLADDIRNDKTVDVDELEATFANAEMLIAHNYIGYAMAVVADQPAKSVSYFDSVVISLDKAIKKLKGDTLKEAQQIKEESVKLQQRIKDGDKNVKDDITAETKKIEDFLTRHKTSLEK